MNDFHMPMMSYVFIGVTTLVLTYATIADTDNEIILAPPESSETSSVIDGLNIPTVNGTIDSIKSLNPFNENDKNIPVAVPVTPDTAPTDTQPKPTESLPSKNPAYGGKKKQTKGKNKKNPIKKQKTKRNRK
tara:strand:+ start:1786 stop:2181 length:396 start_codon:yes stop_codon:yes gene_type:complete